MAGRLDISHIVVMGDSLSDRGTLNKRKLFGLIPMGYFAGLYQSPEKRFTNGYAWDDYFLAKKVSDLQESQLPPTTKFRLIDLNNDKQVNYMGSRYARTYCEGGLTSYDYSKTQTQDFVRENTRKVVSNLKQKRKLLSRDDFYQGISKQEKEKTLVIEWSGANDLFTVNAIPTKKEVDRAITARIDNIKELSQRGYSNFVLFNLPDLSLTPSYAQKTPFQRYHLKRCCQYFNRELKKRIACEFNDDSKVYLFNVNKQFKEIYYHPSRNKFDRKKLNSFLTEGNKNSPRSYFFWDKVHPTTAVHKKLAKRFNEFCEDKFNFCPPAPTSSAKTNCVSDEALHGALNSIYTYLNTIEHAKDTLHLQKRKLLRGLVKNLVNTDGSFDQIKIKLDAFKTAHGKVLNQHQWVFFDKLRGKHTTASMEALNQLEQAVNQLVIG